MHLSHLRLLFPVLLAIYVGGATAHDDVVGREKEFWYGYRVGYITAIRDAYEGTLMCTKDVPLLEVIQVIGAHNKANNISADTAISVKSVTEALSAKYACKRK